jgi:hypothetical protein
VRLALRPSWCACCLHLPLLLPCGPRLLLLLRAQTQDQRQYSPWQLLLACGLTAIAA